VSDKDLVNEGKEERQKTMDKLSVKSGRAYTYDPNKGEGSECGNGKEKADKRQSETGTK
jgi:hypothetical protein